MNKKLLIGALVFILIGLGLITLGLIPKNAERQAEIDNWNRLSGGESLEINGTLVSSETLTITEGTRGNRSIDTVYCPVYEFSVSGQPSKAVARGDDCKESPDEVKIGDVAPIIYDASDPSIAFVNSQASTDYYKDTDGTMIASLGIGGLLVLFGIVMLISARPKTPEQIAAQQEKRRKDDEEVQKLINEVEETRLK